MSPLNIAIHAQHLRDNVGLGAAEPIADIDLVIKKAEFHYMEDHFGDEFSGFCRKVVAGQYLIGFNIDHHWNNGFRRFTLSHELGHLSLPHHLEMLDSGDVHKSKPEFQSRDPIEQEADVFAINFLAPKRAVAEQTKHGDFSRESVRHLSNYFGISYLAAARRFVEATDLACVLIVSNQSGHIEYEIRSDAFQAALGFYPFLHKQTISSCSVTSDFVRGNKKENDCDVYLCDWYPDLVTDVKATESVLELGYNSRYLTLLTPHETDFESGSGF